jgi:hypothetical protein
MVGKRAFETPRAHINHISNGDLESGRTLRKFPRFKDAVEFTMAERTKRLLKEQLRNGLDGDEFEKFRKSDEEVSDKHSRLLRVY